jgi:hypothetical protein
MNFYDLASGVTYCHFCCVLGVKTVFWVSFTQILEGTETEIPDWRQIRQFAAAFCVMGFFCFVLFFSFKTRPYYVVQTGSEFLSSSCPPASAAGATA